MRRVLGRLRVALVESNLVVSTRLTDSMRASKIDVLHTPLSELEARLGDADADVVVAAWSPSERIAVLDILRPRWPTPILLYTVATCSYAQRARALDAGVDDVVVDALDAMDELVARVNAMHRRVSGTFLRALTIGLIAIDIARRAVHVDGVRVDLTPNEFTILSLLAARAPNPVSKAELSGALGYRDASRSHTLKQTVMRLRAKLVGASAQVKAVPAFGYRLDPSG